MEITNEDKVLLLEKLGYKHTGLLSKQMGENYTHPITHHSVSLNSGWWYPTPDISILSKLKDIIAEKHITLLRCNHPKSIDRWEYTIFQGPAEIPSKGATKEEAILKGILEYFKQNKDGNN